MAEWARVENGEIVATYNELPSVWDNISNFNAIDDLMYLQLLGWYKVNKNIPTYDRNTHCLDNATCVFEDDQVVENYDLKPIIVVDPQIEINELEWIKVRATRNQLMADFEWRYSRHDRHLRLGFPPIDQIEDLDKYMQDLADITKQSDPFHITWPVYNKSI